jgi:hypothetical protein
MDTVSQLTFEGGLQKHRSLHEEQQGSENQERSFRIVLAY